MKTRTQRAVAAGALLALVTPSACRTVPSPEIVSVSAPVGSETLRCGARALEGIGYQTREAPGGLVEAEQEVPGRGTPLDRHRVELTVERGERPALVAVITRWRYQGPEPARSARGAVGLEQARPDPDEVEAVRSALEPCGSPPPSAGA